MLAQIKRSTSANGAIQTLFGCSRGLSTSRWFSRRVPESSGRAQQGALKMSDGLSCRGAEK